MSIYTWVISGFSTGLFFYSIVYLFTIIIHFDLFFKSMLVIIGSLHVYINFGISLLSFTKRNYHFFIGVVLNLEVNLARIYIFIRQSSHLYLDLL